MTTIYQLSCVAHLLLFTVTMQAKEEAGQYVGPQYWLLDKDRAVRIAVHHRRGDVAVVATHKYRYLPVSYYLNVVQDIIQVSECSSWVAGW